MSLLCPVPVGFWVISIVIMGCASMGGAATGDSCEEKEECASGFCLQESRWGAKTGWSEGYCTQSCGDGCADNAPCVDLDGRPYCLAPCRSDGDCRGGYLCDPWVYGCLPDCRLGWFCGDAYDCREDGYCADSDAVIPDYPGGDGGVTGRAMGDPCELNSDCESDYCIPEQVENSGISWTEGTCSQLCGSCPAGFGCTSIAEIGLCLSVCQGNFDCRQGYVCHPGWTVCLPDCRLGFDCGTELHCNAKGICGAGGSGIGDSDDSGGWGNSRMVP